MEIQRDERGRFLTRPANSAPPITTERAREFAQLRQEKKRQKIIDGANYAIQQDGRFDGRDLDFVEAIAEVQAIKATNPDDPKSTDAARFLLQEAGLSEKQAQTDAGQSLGALADVVNALSDFAAQIANLREDNSEVVDADSQSIYQ